MSELSLSDQLKQLKQAKEIVEKEPSHYPAILSSILPIAQRTEPELRVWCAEFLVDAFSNEDIDVEIKTPLATQCLDTIVRLLDDSFILVKQNAVTCAASLYSVVFSYVCTNPSEALIWNKLLQIKTKVLGLLESSHFGVQAASVKFAQQVVLVQSTGSRDPRLAGTNDVSLSCVPIGHPLIDNTLEAEGLGLLDRLLSVFSDHQIYSPKITCTINALYPIIKNRPAIASKAVTYILNFDSSQKITTGNDDARSELEYRFVDKSLRLMLTNIQKHNLVPKMSSRISEYLSTFSQGRASEKLKRRITQQGDDTPSKRVRLGRSTMPVNASTTMPSGPCSYSQLFNLINTDDPLASFDAKELSIELAVNIALAGISAANEELLNNSIEIIKARYNNLKELAPLQSQFNQLYPMDSYQNDDYEEDDYTGDNQIAVQGEGDNGDDNNNTPPLDSDDDDDDPGALLPAASFSLPPPEPLSLQERTKQIGKVVDRLISYSTFSEVSTFSGSVGSSTQQGLNRVAVTEWNKNTWVILTSRILTRGICHNSVDENIIRDHLFNYVMGNFKERLDLIVLWLTEEWFGEYRKNGDEAYNPSKDCSYYIWTHKVLDQIMPLLEPSDKKGFLRFLSDLPVFTEDLIYKLKSMCIDPYRSQMGLMALRFLIMLKPPVKEYCLNLLSEIYKEDPTSGAKNILKQYRPEVLEEVKPESEKEEIKVES